LLSARGAEALRSGLAAFLLAFAPTVVRFLGAAVLAGADLAFAAPLGSLGGFLSLGRGLLLASVLAGEGLLRRDVRALCRNGGGLSVALVSAVVICVGILFCAGSAHDD
jgi:hypothetical protein